MVKQAAPNICPFCGYGNRLGVIFCEECGNPLDAKMSKAGATRAVPQASPNDPGLEEIQKIIEQTQKEQAAAQPGAGLFDHFDSAPAEVSPSPSPASAAPRQQTPSAGFVFLPTSQFSLEIEGSQRPLVMGPVGQKDLIVGRNDPEDHFKPDVDLVPFGAMEHGISRRHASLISSGNRLQIMDLQSSNGTFLNGHRLDAREPHQLRDGDQLRFGNLRMTVKFL